MPKSGNQDTRLAWSTPELRRIRAGSAEAVDNQGNGDGGISPNHKS